jgi:hypothetical protein
LLQAWRDTPGVGTVRVLCMADDTHEEHVHWLVVETMQLRRERLELVVKHLADRVPWDLEEALGRAAHPSRPPQDVVARPLHIVRQHRSETD